MKKTLIMLILLAVVVGGCTSAERIDALQSSVDATATAIEVMRESIAETKAQIAEQPDNEKLVEKLDDTESLLARYEPMLLQLQKNLADAKAGGEVAMIGTTLTTAAPLMPPPYGTYAYLAGLIITGLGGKKLADRNTVKVTDKYVAHKRGLKSAELSSEPLTAESIYAAIGKARSELGVK